MIVEVSANTEINFSPKTKEEKIVQNVRTILVTRKGSVPLDRDFGLTWEHIDKPISIARSLQQAEIIDAIEQYEPEATVQSVEWDDNITDAMEGILSPRVIISTGQEEEEDY